MFELKKENLLKFRSVLLIYIFLLSIAFFNKLSAQQVSFIRFAEADGLPSNTTYYTIQDSFGYLWIATGSGVVRYDGYSFKTYTTEDGLSGNEVFQIFEDSQHRIWFVTYEGAPSYFKNGVFYSAQNDSTLKKIITTGMGLKVVEDDEKNIWYLTTYELVQISSSGIVKQFPCEERDGGRVTNFSVECDQSRIMTIDLIGIKVIENGKEHRINTKDFVPPGNPCKSILINHKVYYTNQKALCTIDCDNRYKFSLDSLPFFSISISKGSSNHNLFIGSYQGLFEYDVLMKNVQPSGFEDEAISSSLLDSENGLWLTTLSNGLYYVCNRKSFLFEGKTKKSLGNIGGLKSLSQNTIGIGLEDYSFTILKKNKSYDYHFELNKGQGLIKKFEIGPDSSIYIPASPYLFIVDKSLEKVDVVSSTITNIKFRKTTGYFIQGSRILVIKNFTKKTLIEIQDKKKLVELEKSKKVDVLSTTKSFGICLDSDSSCYTYGTFGIKYFVNEKEKEFPFKNPVFSKIIFSLKQSETGWIWFFSETGVGLFNKDTFHLINTKDGLSSIFVTNIYLEPHSNTAWVTTENGLNKIDYEFTGNEKFEFSIKKYTMSNGLLSNKINEVFVKNDSIWIASTKGINIIHKKDLDISTIPQNVIIEEIHLDGLLNIPVNNTVELNYGQNFKIKYVAISFNKANSIVYKYKLEGLSENWNTTNSRELEFPTLPPGEFIFYIQAEGLNGGASKMNRIKIIVKPNYYQTVVFKVFVVLFIILIAIFFVLRVLTKQKAEHLKNQKMLVLENEKIETERKEAVYEKELLLLEQKALRLHINPHFIFNSISAISGFYISGNYEAGKDYTSKFSKLLRLILSTTEKAMIRVSTEVEILKNYFDLTLLRFENKFEYNINIDPNIDIEKVYIPSMLIQPFVENSIIHGIAPLETKGRITVSFVKIGDSIVCTIDDNGIGREKSSEISNDRMHKPTGLIVTKERINYYSNFHDKLEIIDKKDDFGNSTGTTIVFKILFEIK